MTPCWRDERRARDGTCKVLIIWATSGPSVSSETFLFAGGPSDMVSRPLGKRGHQHTPAQTLKPKPVGVQSPCPSSRVRPAAVRYPGGLSAGISIPAPPWTRGRTRFCGGRGRAWVWVYQAQEARQPPPPRWRPQKLFPAPNPASAVGTPRLPASPQERRSRCLYSPRSVRLALLAGARQVADCPSSAGRA